MSRRFVLGAAAAALVVVAAVLALWPDDQKAPAAPRPLIASTSVSPELPLFADPLRAELRVLVDGRLADPRSVRIDARFTPYRAVGSAERLESRVGDSILLRYRFRLECLTRACLPKPRGFVFPPARIAYAVRGSAASAQQLTASWPAFLVSGRVDKDDLARPTMKEGLRPLPSVSYSLPPDGLAVVLGGAAVLLAAGAGGLVVRRRPRALPVTPSVPERNGVLSPLEAALALVRQAAARGDAQMQRKALERLATELQRLGHGSLAQSARRLAWSEPDPRAEATDSLADDVTRIVGGGV